MILEELQNIGLVNNTNRIKLQELVTNLGIEYKSLKYEEEDININQFLKQYDNYAKPLGIGLKLNLMIGILNE